MASPVGSALAAGGLAEADGAGVGAGEVGAGDADGLAGGFDWPHAETIRTAMRASKATAGRRPDEGRFGGTWAGLSHGDAEGPFRRGPISLS